MNNYMLAVLNKQFASSCMRVTLGAVFVTMKVLLSLLQVILCTADEYFRCNPGVAAANLLQANFGPRRM